MKKKIALVCIAKNEDYYLQEWIDYHLKLGFDDIHVFQNNWRFKDQKTDSRVYFHEYDGVTDINDNPIWIRNIQARCYTEFSKNYYNHYEWTAFFDVDEFLVLKQTDDVKEFISNYNNESCVVINWAMFGDNGITNFDESNTNVLQRFTKRQRGMQGQFKGISKLNEDLRHVIHWSGDGWVDPDLNRGDGGYNLKGNYNIAQLNHYFTKTYPEFLLKVERGNACRSGVDGKRENSDFHSGNFNEVEDLNALNFYNRLFT